MRIGVTGGAGFIGSYVRLVLRERGHVPVLFDRRQRDGLDSALSLGDIRDEVAVDQLAAYVDGIVHLASVLGTQETVAFPKPAVMTNIEGALNVFEAATRHNIPVVNICVGNAGMANPYSASKTCVETLGHMYVRDRGLRLNQVRLVNAYGPGQAVAAPYGSAKVRKIMPSFVCRALAGDSIEVYGDGNQVSDMVWVRDGARALVLALEAAAAGTVVPQVMECGPATHSTVVAIANAVAEEVDQQTGQRPTITHLPMRPGETPGAYVTCNPDTLAPIGMKPGELKPLNEGIAETVKWYRLNEGLSWRRP